MALRILLFLISTVGLIGAVHARTRLSAAFCPAAAVSLQILVLYVFALFGGLLWGAYTVCALGLLGLIYCCFRPNGFRALLHPGVLFFFLYGAVLALALRDTQMVGFDNYSHWAVIVKDLFRTNALPREGTMVTFKNYPPAAALYQYFVLKFTGFGEAPMLAAFNLLSGAFLACCFVKTQKNKPADLLLRLLLVLSLTLVVPNAMQNLYVDSFLGYAALAVGCVALSDEAFSRGGIALQATAGAVLVLTKMSGVFLLIPHLVLLFLRRRVLPEKERRSVRWILLILAGVFTAAFLSYSLYAKFTFPAVAGHNAFEMSFAALKRVGAIKSADFWAVFPARFFGSFVDSAMICNLFFWGIGAFWLLLLPFFIYRKKSGKRPLKGALYALGTVLFYTAGLAAMYLFMMNENDSIQVASFYRYFGTVVIYITGVLFVNLQLSGGLSALFPAEQACAGYLLVSTVLTALCARALWPGTAWERKHRARNEAFVKNDIAVAKALDDGLDPGVPIFVGTEMTDIGDGFAYLHQRYAFWSEDVRPLAGYYWEKRQPGAFYLVWIKENETGALLLREAGFSVPEKPGCYYVDEQNQTSQVCALTIEEEKINDDAE